MPHILDPSMPPSPAWPRPVAEPTPSPPDAPAAAAPTALPGPPAMSLRLDPALGLVVIEFRDQTGHVESLPTQRELDAYRRGGATPPGPPEAGAVAAPAPE